MVMNSKSKEYILTIAVSILIVLSVAGIQYHLIQDLPFNIVDYLIPFAVGGSFGFMIAHIRILQRKFQLEKDQVLEKNKKIHMYVGTIVHDLKSPISAVYSILELLKIQNEIKKEKSIKLVDLARNSIESMLENIQLLLDNTKLESGKMMVHLEKGNPYYTINSTIDKHIIQAIDKSISIQRIIDKNLPEVEYDKGMLDRVLSNLISNSIKYSPSKTQIRIYSELLSGNLNLVVEDQGLGLSSEDQENLFHEFQTLSARPTAGESSSGLGLSVAKKLVEEMGGEIWCESEGKGKGAKFKVALPIMQRN